MKTPLWVGVFVRFCFFFSLFGGHKILWPEFIPVYMIYATPGKSFYNFETENMHFRHKVDCNMIFVWRLCQVLIFYTFDK